MGDFLVTLVGGLLVLAVVVVGVRWVMAQLAEYRGPGIPSPSPLPTTPGPRRTTDAIVSTCPRCGATRTLVSKRYLGHVCPDCVEHATDSTGRPVRGFNTSVGGGFAAYYVEADGSSGQTVCEEVTRTHVVHIDGGRYWMDEARFGGTVVMPLSWAEQNGLVPD